MNVYQFTVKDAMQNEISLESYKGKVLLIVNTASHCGFTHQYKELASLYETYKDQGFEILDFPCNQFLNQAPESSEELAQFCQLHYSTTFKTFDKILVNGKQADPLYKYLKKECGGLFSKSIKWNFTKFLVDRNGKVVKRFAPQVNPLKLESSIKDLLAK